MYKSTAQAPHIHHPVKRAATAGQAELMAEMRTYSQSGDTTERASPAETVEQKHLSRIRCISDRTRVEENTPLGRSVFATAEISSCCLLGVYPGAHRTIDDFNSRGEYILPALRYAYYLSDTTVIDPCDEYGELPNHAELRLALVNEPPPGASVNILAIPSKHQVWFITLRAIAKGAELFTSYGSNYPRDYLSDISGTNGACIFDEYDMRNLRRISTSFPWLGAGVSALLEATSIRDQSPPVPVQRDIANPHTS